MKQESRYLETPGLRLRPVRADDGPALMALFNSPYVRRYLLDDERVDATWVDAAILESERMFDRVGLGLWALFEGDRTELCGFCGFIAEENEPRLIYGLAEALTGRGLAREAAVAVVAVAAARGMKPVRASVDAANTSSRKLLEALCFEIVQTNPGRSGDVLIYAHQG